MKLLKFTSKIGQGIVVLFTMIFISIIIISYVISKQNVVNPFCKNKYENEEIILLQEGIVDYSYNYSCSTIYFFIEVEGNLSKEQILAIILSVGNQISYLDCFTQFEVNSLSLDKPIYATIDLKTLQLNYVGG